MTYVYVYVPHPCGSTYKRIIIAHACMHLYMHMQSCEYVTAERVNSRTSASWSSSRSAAVDIYFTDNIYIYTYYVAMPAPGAAVVMAAVASMAGPDFGPP